MATLSLFPTISAKIGRPKSFLVAAVAQVIGFALLFICGRSVGVPMVGACSAIVNIGIGFMLVLVTVSLADVVDYGEYKFGTRNEAIIFSMQTFVVKLAGAVSGFISGVGLTAIGYVANQDPSPATVSGMQFLMIVVPAILAILTYIIYLLCFKLKGEYLEEVKAAIKQRRAEKGEA